jgi:hypothetical protein
MTPAEILARLEDCTIERFGHAEHVAAAWEALRVDPFDRAAARICSAIQRFAAAHGKSSKFDQAMTVGFLRIIDSCRRDLGWAEFRGANPGLFDRTDREVRRLMGMRRSA